MRCLLDDGEYDLGMLDTDGHAVPSSLELDAMDGDSAVAWRTEAAPCEPGRRCRMSILVRRARGEGRIAISLQWLDAAGQTRAAEQAWSSELAGCEWVQEEVAGTAPAGAYGVRGGVEAGPGCCVTLRDLRLEIGPAAATRDDDPPVLPPVAHAIRFPLVTKELPEPCLVETPLRLGAHYRSAMSDWDYGSGGIRRSADTMPVLGCYDEWSGDVADWHIHWAISHGISWFAYEWHYNQGYLCCNDALDRGLLAGRFAAQMPFCINWRNDGRCTEFRPLDFSHHSLDGFIRTLCVRYFHMPNYLRVGERLVVIIGSPARIANAHGGWDGCAHALDRMRAAAADCGHTGVYFVAQHDGGSGLPPYGRGGFDAVTTGSCGMRGVPAGVAPPRRSCDELLARQREHHAGARRQARDQGIAYIPAAWAGTADTGPELLRHAVTALPEFAEPTPPLALVDSWNGWGDGSRVEPGEPHGFARLSAIRDALSSSHDDYRVHVPTPAEVARLNTDVTRDMLDDLYLGRYSQDAGLADGFRMTFNSPHALWLRPLEQVCHVRIEEGVLAGDSIGCNPVLAGPPMMGLPAERVPGVALRMRMRAGRAARIYWTTDAAATRGDELSVAFGVNADGYFHDYVVRLAANPAWTGAIRQLFFSPTDAPGRFEIREFRTISIEDEEE